MTSYEARAEESLGLFESDVLLTGPREPSPPPHPVHGAERFEPVATLSIARPVHGRHRRVGIYSTEDERRVAVVEIVSRGHKDARPRAAKFREKVLACIDSGIHVAIVDLWPCRGRRSDDGEPDWSDLATGIVDELVTGSPLPAHDRAATSFEVSLEPSEVRVYLEALEPGRPLPRVPLFLEPGRPVALPLDATYAETVADLPATHRRRLAGNARRA